MEIKIVRKAGLVLLAALVALVLNTGKAGAVVDGISGTSFQLTAQTGYISGGDGRQIFIWGLANGLGAVQYPGPTLILQAGDIVTVQLTNTLAVNTSIIFPGMDGVSVAPLDPGVQGLLTSEAPAQVGLVPGTVTYTFTATNPGTYYYQSATNPDLQVEMGLFGAIVVYPAGAVPLPGVSTPGQAYGTVDTAYDYEYLFLLSEMDPSIHEAMEVWAGPPSALPVNTTDFFAKYWFINGRNGMDDMLDPNVPYLPTQPYNCLPRVHPGETALLRVIGMGRDAHPFHTHGNNFLQVAEDGALLSTDGAAADLAKSNFTITMSSGKTADLIWVWTGNGLGWDIYGPDHGAAYPHELAADHNQPFPTPIPHVQDITRGQLYPGSPFLGGSGPLPPGEGGFNPTNAFTFMFHSHTEKELVNNNIFPGGMMTMMFVEHPDIIIP